MLFYEIEFSRRNRHRHRHRRWSAPRRINRVTQHSTINVDRSMANNAYKSMRIHRVWAMWCHSIFSHRHILLTIFSSLRRKHWTPVVWPIHRRAACDRSYGILVRAVVRWWGERIHWTGARSVRAALEAVLGICTESALVKRSHTRKL